MDKNKQPGISFDTILLKELLFSRKEDLPQKPELSVKVSKSLSFSPEEDIMNFEMTCEIKDEDNLFGIKCTMIGIFSVITGNENMTLQEFSQKNAPALVFPYIREVIASTTTRAGIPAVIIPPINLSAIDKKQSEEKQGD